MKTIYTIHNNGRYAQLFLKSIDSEGKPVYGTNFTFLFGEATKFDCKSQCENVLKSVSAPADWDIKDIKLPLSFETSIQR